MSATNAAVDAPQRSRDYDVVYHGDQATFVLVPVADYEEMIMREMAREAIAQIERGDDGELVNADDFALQLAGERLASAREKAGLTQKQLGAKLGMPQSQISRIERNPDRTTVRTIRKIARALGVDVSAFLNFASR